MHRDYVRRGLGHNGATHAAEVQLAFCPYDGGGIIWVWVWDWGREEIPEGGGNTGGLPDNTNTVLLEFFFVK